MNINLNFFIRIELENISSIGLKIGQGVGTQFVDN